MAYSRVTDGYWQIWTYDLETEAHAQRTFSRSDKRDPSWLADGGIVYRSHNDELFVLVAGAMEETPFRRDLWPAFDPSGAPDGSGIALSKLQTDAKDQSAIWLVGAATGDQRVLTRGPGLWTHPDWSSDGTRLTYIRSFGYRGSELRTLQLADGQEEILIQDAAHNVHPAWSPDDRAIVFASDRSGDYEIYVRDVARGQDVRLTERRGLDIRPTWSPDGSHIAYASFQDGKLEIWRMAADGSHASRLFSADADVSDPVWR